MPSVSTKSKSPHLWQPRTRRWFLAVAGFSLFYTALRYIVFARVPPDQWPLFLGNKAISFAGLILIALSYTIGKFGARGSRDSKQHLVLVKFCGLFGFALIAMHVFASLAILSPAHYPYLFLATGKMSLAGQIGILMGVFCLWCFTMPVITSIPHMFEAIGGERWLRFQRMGYIGLATAALHVAFLGFHTWLTPDDWYGYMPPITSLAAAAALVPLLLKLRPNR